MRGSGLTIRNVPDEVADRLKRLSRERGSSVNSTVLELLARAVDVRSRRARLEEYATWTDEDAEDFDDALSAQRVIDAELWR